MKYFPDTPRRNLRAKKALKFVAAACSIRMAPQTQTLTPNKPTVSFRSGETFPFTEIFSYSKFLADVDSRKLPDKET